MCNDDKSTATASSNWDCVHTTHNYSIYFSFSFWCMFALSQSDKCRNARDAHGIIFWRANTCARHRNHTQAQHSNEKKNGMRKSILEKNGSIRIKWNSRNLHEITMNWFDSGIRVIVFTNCIQINFDDYKVFAIYFAICQQNRLELFTNNRIVIVIKQNKLRWLWEETGHSDFIDGKEGRGQAPP